MHEMLFKNKIVWVKWLKHFLLIISLYLNIETVLCIFWEWKKKVVLQKLSVKLN